MLTFSLSIISFLTQMSLSNMSSLIAMISKTLSTISANIWPFASMGINMIIKFLSISKSFATMITFIFSIIWMDVSLLNMSFFSSHWDHQATMFARYSTMCSFDMIVQMIFGFANFWTFWTFL